MILGSRLGIGHDPGRHVAYVGSWIKVLQGRSAQDLPGQPADARKSRLSSWRLNSSKFKTTRWTPLPARPKQAEGISLHIQEAHKNANPGYSALESWQTLERTAEANGLKAIAPLVECLAKYGGGYSRRTPGYRRK